MKIEVVKLVYMPIIEMDTRVYIQGILLGKVPVMMFKEFNFQDKTAFPFLLLLEYTMV